jgi:hypothetical protein
MEPQLNSVSAVYTTEEADVFLIDCNITDTTGATYDTQFVSRPDDPYGLAPLIRQWLADNPDFPRQPYVPPTPSLNEQITTAPIDLTGGPSLADIFGGSGNQLFPN